MLSKATKCQFKVAMINIKRFFKWFWSDIKTYFRYKIWRWKKSGDHEAQERAMIILKDAEKIINEN